MKTYEIPEAIFNAIIGAVEILEPITIDGHLVNRRIKEITAPEVAENNLGWLKVLSSADGSHRIEGVELHTSRANATDPSLNRVNPKCIMSLWYRAGNYYERQGVFRSSINYDAADGKEGENAYFLISSLVLLAEQFDYKVRRDGAQSATS